MIQQYFDQNLDQYSEFINWYEENKARFSNNAQAKIDADEWTEKFRDWLDNNPDMAKKYKQWELSNKNAQSIAEVTVKGVYIPDKLVGSAAAGFLQSAQGIGKSFMNFIAPKADAAAQGEEEPNQDPADLSSGSTSSEPIAPGSSGGSGANPSDQSGPNPEDDLYGNDEGDFAPGSTQPADDFDDEREGNDLKNPYSDITVSPDGSLNKPKPGNREFDQEGNVVPKPNRPDQAPVGGAGNISDRPSSSDVTPSRPDVLDQPVPGSSSSSVPDQAPVGGAGNISDRPSSSDSQSTKPTAAQPPVPKPRPETQPKYYPGVTEPDYNKSLRIAQNTLKQAQRKLSQGNLSNLDKMQAQTDVQRQNQLIKMYQDHLLANPRTEKGRLIHHGNMLNRSAVAAGQSGDQRTRAEYKKKAAQVKVNESRFTNLQNYINKL